MIDQPEHRVLREALGAYVLGHLSDPEAENVAAHLKVCAECRAELDEVAPAAAALAQVRRSAPEAAMPPADLGRVIEQRIWAEDRRARSRHTVKTAVASALATAAVAVGVIGGLNLATADPAPVVALESVSVQESGGIAAAANLVDHTWGVEVKLTASGLEPGEEYEVAVLGAEGSEFPAGAFVGTDGEVVCNLNSAVLRDDSVGFVVRDEAGRQVLRSDFGPPDPAQALG